ncbi:MAG TPA: hypothetical protein VFV38_35540 [Ktedonobacteraceae bacterium]|nr:hypothetical protein [Ktedonobacteraceae bacterium]
MQTILSSPTLFGIGLIVTGIISGVLGIALIIYDILKGNHLKEQKKRDRWYRRARTVLGMGLIILSFPMLLNILVLTFVLHHHLSSPLEVFVSVIGIISVLVWFAMMVYTAVLQIQSKNEI